ncbi:MAG: hypothetical protein QW176_02060 [Candidatus Bathyarchaeia archaeon]
MPKTSALRFIPSKESPDFSFRRLQICIYLFEDGITEVCISGLIETYNNKTDSVEFMILWPSIDIERLQENKVKPYGPIAKCNETRLKDFKVIRSPYGSKYAGLIVQLLNVTDGAYFGIWFVQNNYPKIIQTFPYKKCWFKRTSISIIQPGSMV